VSEVFIFLLHNQSTFQIYLNATSNFLIIMYYACNHRSTTVVPDYRFRTMWNYYCETIHVMP